MGAERHIFKGIQRDLSKGNFSPEFAYDAKNIRVTARDNSTLLSVTNEKGTKEFPIYKDGSVFPIEGIIIGNAVLNNYVIIFTTSLVDRIYRLEINEDYSSGMLLFQGSLGFNADNPIECFGVYENENIQKVYWVDGINQPRVINITASDTIRNTWNNNSFNFVQDLKLQEEVKIVRNDLTNGFFSPGTIQYAFTYYNKYGQESNIFYTSPINYISYSERGGSPEDKCSNSFDISISGIDTNFDYLRIYSLHRTSIDAVPTVLNVIDISIEGKTNITYTDNGATGVTIDPTELLYIGGESIIASTMTHKDNTLFLGNITLSRPSIPDNIKQSIRINDINNSNLVNTSLRIEEITINFDDAYYTYANSLSAGNTAGFKSGEHYRLGVQFQYKTGKWSEPIFIGDYTIPDETKPNLLTSNNKGTLYIPQVKVSLPSSITNQLISLGYVKLRSVAVFPTLQDRRIVTQGMLCPTVFNVGNRNNSTPFAQSSWFLRPNLPWDIEALEGDRRIDNNKDVENGAWVEFRHHWCTFNGANRGAEIQNTNNNITSADLNRINGSPDVYSDMFFIDQSIITMHSPDIEFDTLLQTLNYANLQLRIVGAINFTSSIGDIDIQTSSPTVHPSKATGFYHKSIGVEGPSEMAARSLVSGLFYRDWIVDDDTAEKYGYYDKETSEVAWLVYPWQKLGSINNDINVTSRARSAVLSKKKISNLKFSSHNTWFNNSRYWYAKRNDVIHNGITNVQLFNSNEVVLTKIPIPENALIKSINYYGNVDSLLVSKNSYNQYFSGKTDTGWDTPSFSSSSFNTIEEDVIEIGDKNDNLINSKDPVQMKYKSTPHFVFSLNYTSESNSQVILPATYGTSTYGINTIGADLATNKPYWMSKTEEVPTGSFTTLKYVWRGNSDPNGYYPDTLGWVDGDYYYDDFNDILYKYAPYAGVDETFPFVPVHQIYTAGDKFKYNDGNTLRYYEVIYLDGLYVLNEYYSYTSEDVEFSIRQDVIAENIQYPYLFLAELYREESDLDNVFGGTSEEALKNNQWVPTSESKLLCPEGNSIDFIYGDTWYQRYDCLKTYPFTFEDMNSVVEIGSFMCETRVNIDGRYDKNRGQISNLVRTPNNFNLINNVYSQKDNFFNYKILDKDYYKLNKFNNTITWTKEKQLGATIDLWTNITMASTLDLDGDKGEITSLNTFNNEIYCFQDKGFSNILFNSRVQIPTSDGVPIEITNGLKVQGKRYISNHLGCTNKWSIVESVAGLFFIDNNTDSIYIYNGQVSSLSDSLGFSSWVNNISNQNKWNPINFSNTISYYDKANGDIYFTGKDYCLCYSESINQFTSFMSYESVYPMFNVYNKLYSFKDNKMWEHFAGEYNMFYNKFQPYYITFVANDTPITDKIFNTVEFRSDSWDSNNMVINNTFDTLDVWNEYQKGSSCLTFNAGYPSSLKRKFRIWRANIPRDSHNMRDRIRNTWAFIKLSMNNLNTWKTEFHDAIIHYIG